MMGEQQCAAQLNDVRVDKVAQRSVHGLHAPNKAALAPLLLMADGGTTRRRRDGGY